MKIKLLSIVCLMLVSFGFAQTQTITVPWDFFTVPASDTGNFPLGPMFDTEFTIEVGDTVVWEWLSNGHNVKSVPGATETFGTTGGDFDTFPMPYTYSYTFTQVGVNGFVCKPHEFFMYGTITVVPEGTLSAKTFDKLDFKISPNPSSEVLNIVLPNQPQNVSVEVFDVLGKKVFSTTLSDSKQSIQVSEWTKGFYLVRIVSDNGTQTKRFIKQ